MEKPTGHPSYIKFTVLSPQQLKNISILNINRSELYDQTTKTPKQEGVLDTRLGLSTQIGLCSTCRLDISKCNGHFGHINLCLPVFHCGFLKHVVKILQKICTTCALIDCNCRRSKVVKRGAKVYCDDIVMTPCDVLNLFKMIPEDLYSELGLCDSPEHLIIQTVVVPPATIRPTVNMEEQFTTNEDDLTVKLAEILHTNEVLKKSIEKGNPMSVINDDWDFLQMQVNMYINSDGSIRGLIQRLKGKHGRFRGNLSGKRVDFTGRTVISPDPNLSIEEVGIPIHMAKNLTIPERVTHFNIERLRKFVLNGNKFYPGANFVETSNSTNDKIRKHLFFNRRQIARELKIGDLVERHLLNNDVVLFNRQPSLHRISIMAHKVRVHPNKTLRLNECVCTPYNADFDGDEMNIHVPQTISSTSDSLFLMSVKENLYTPRNGEILIAPTQDFITFLYLLTAKDTFFTREKFGMVAAVIELKIKIKPVIVRPIELFTGKQVFEAILSCREVSLEEKNNNYQGPHESIKFISCNYEKLMNLCPHDGFVVIRNGKFLFGRLDKSLIGSGNKKTNILYRVLKNSKGQCVEVMNKISKLSARMMGELGFSIGIDDVWIDQELKNKIVSRGYLRCEEKIENYKKGLLERHPGCSSEETLENILSSILSQIREDCGTVCLKELSKTNSTLIMQECGSKGSKINISQMAACVGQQIISGKRIPNGFITRTLPHFDNFEVSPESKGFVENSFFSGLRPTEFFFHAVSGREGLVDTAVKTAETGYMQRRLMKALEDINVAYDFTVRNLNRDIIQFMFGDDGIDPMICEEGVINYRRIYLESRNLYLENVYAKKNLFIDREFMQIHENNNNNLNNTLNNNLNKKDTLIKNLNDNDTLIKNLNEVKNKIISDEKNLINELQIFNKNPEMRRIIERIKNESKNNFIDLITKDSLLNQKSISGYAINNIINDIWDIYLTRIFKSLSKLFIEPGTSVGAIAGQSIGEPGTQMTLKTFHFAGVASMNITLGVPRLKEIINATKNISTPIINAFIKDEKDENPINEDKNPINEDETVKDRNLKIAKKIKMRIQKTTLSDILVYLKEIFRSDSIYIEIGVEFDGDINQVVNNLCDGLKISKGCMKIIKDENEFAADSRNQENEEKKDNFKNFKNNSESLNLHKILLKIKRFGKKETSDNLYFVLQNLKSKLKQTLVSGLESAKRIVINNYEGDKYNLLIEGTGLLGIFNIEGIDSRKTVSNDILDIVAVLGIEAARTAIINEILYTMGKHGIKLDLRHVMLLADTMTYVGSVLGITRHGIKHMKTSTLMLASFEQTADHIFESAISGKVDKIKGISENIIVGSRVPIGTGIVELLYDGKLSISMNSSNK
ncbi:DNA-directed RNA polymerase III subunit RPC1 [Dictyocoela muelleri]|nr:DNA-directed RNA polymerase III subunit RPC1 [Dictyocoela muelleri]